MLDIGWSEMAVVAVIALIIVGPKDLPRILRYVGRWAGKARAMAREFQSSIDDMVREAELDEVKKDVESVASYDVKKEIEQAVDPTGVLTPDLDPTGPEGEGGGETAGEGKAPAPSAAADAEAPAEEPADAGPTPAEPAPADAEPAPVEAADEPAAPAKSRAGG